MSFRGQLIKAGIDSNGTDISIFSGTLTLQTDNKLIFRDSGCFIHSNADGYLTIEADTGIVIAAPFSFTGTLTVGTAAIGISFTGAYTTAGIQMGSSGSKLELAVGGDYAIEINTNSDIVTGTNTAFYLKSTMAGRLGEEQTMYVHSYTAIYGGNENTVGHFYSEWVGTGIGPVGMTSSVTAKMLLPTGCVGAFFPFYGKINFPATPYAGITGTGNSCGWFMLSIGGDSGGYSNFDDYGLFMEIHNISAGDGNLLSENSATLRCAIPSAGANKYLILSNAEDCLSFAARTSAYSAILVGATGEGNGVQLNASSLPDYAVEIYADVVTSTLTNVGALNCRVTIADTAVVTSNSFTTASYNRINIEGAATLSGWVVGVLGYYRTDASAVVSASASYNAAIVGLMNLGSGYTDPAGTTHAFIAGTYASSTGAISVYSAYYVHATGSGFANFDIGFFMGDTGATIGMQLNDCTTGLYLEGAMTTGISITGGMTTGISISQTGASTVSRAINSNFTIAGPAHTDGYSAHEFNLGFSGSSGNSTAAFGGWLNVSAATLGSGNHYTCCQTGIWEGGGTISGAKLAGFRFQAQLSQGGFGYLVLASINSSGQAFTALFALENYGVTYGYSVGVGESNAPNGYLALVCDTGGTVKYVRLYDAVEPT